jgi:signal recognition particle GTPase
VKPDYDAFEKQLRVARRTAPVTRKLARLVGVAPAEEIDVDHALRFIAALTPEERADPDRIGADTLSRVALDTGLAVTELSMLHQHFLEARERLSCW